MGAALSQFILPDDLVTGASELPGDEPRVMSTKERQEAVLGKTAMEFDTEDQLKKYLDAHPKADRARHKVKAPGPEKNAAPAPKKASEDKMSRLEELRVKVAAQKVAFKPASEEFVEWVLLKNDRLTAMECQKFMERVGLELDGSGTKSGPFDVGEMVSVDKRKNTNPLNVDVCEKWHDNAGTIYEAKTDHYVVQFPNNERVQFMGNKPGAVTGLYRYTPASVADKPGRQAIEMIYLSDSNAPLPSKENLELVQAYVNAGTAKGEKRFDIYYSGLPSSMGISKEGMFYFRAYVAQRSSPNLGDYPRTFNPTKGKCLYLGILNRRPGGWESDLAKMRLQKGATEPGANSFVNHQASETELRAAVVKMAHDVPEMRKHLILILDRTK